MIRLIEKKAKLPKQEILPFRFIQDNTFVIVKDAVKTMNEIKIPLNEKALQILVKYDFRLPRYEGQVINRVLKEILMKVPEFQLLERHKVETYGRVIKDTTVPKYQLITNHTARRSFITLCVDANIDIKTIMKMTGHKKLETLNIYIDKAKKIEDKWISLMNF